MTAGMGLKAQNTVIKAKKTQAEKKLPGKFGSSEKSAYLCNRLHEKHPGA